MLNILIVLVVLTGRKAFKHVDRIVWTTFSLLVFLVFANKWSQIGPQRFLTREATRVWQISKRTVTNKTLSWQIPTAEWQFRGRNQSCSSTHMQQVQNDENEETSERHRYLLTCRQTSKTRAGLLFGPWLRQQTLNLQILNSSYVPVLRMICESNLTFI